MVDRYRTHGTLLTVGVTSEYGLFGGNSRVSRQVCLQKNATLDHS